MLDVRPAPPPSGALRWRAQHWFAVLGILLIGGGVGWWSRLRDLGAGGDDATYVVLSQSLEQGRYNEEYLVDAPPHGKYPPGFSAWIATIRQVAGPDLDAVRFGNLLLLALTATLIGSAVRRLGGAWLGVGAVAATAFNPTLLDLTGQVFSEVSYTALATLAVWATLLADHDNRRRWILLATVAALAGFLTRSIGIALVPGIVGWALLRRRWTTVTAFGLASVVVVGGWFAWVRHVAASTAGLTYIEELQAIGGRSEGALNAIGHRIVSNAEALGAHIDFEVLGLPMLKGAMVDNLFWLLLLAPPAVVGLWLLLRRWPAAAISLGISTGILLVWNGVDARLLSPLIPTAIAAILLGGASLGRRLLRRAPAVGIGLLPVLLSVLGLTTYLAQDRRHLCDGRDAYADTGCFDPDSRGVVLAARFVRDSLPKAVVVATSKPATVFYFSGHKTVSLTPLLKSVTTPGSLQLSSRGVDFVILNWMSAFEARRGHAIIQQHCGELSLRATILSSALLLARRDSLSGMQDACAAVTLFTSVGQQTP